jgi:curved DNA-binding protein CbpA
VKKPTTAIPATDAQRRSIRSPGIPIVITSTTAKTGEVREETSALSINAHSYRYFSRFRPRIGARITIQVIVPKEDTSLPARPQSARIIWSRKSKRPDGLYQICVEFDAPLNLGQPATRPADVNSFSPQLAPDLESGAGKHAGPLPDEIERLLQFARGGTHYQLLDVRPDLDPASVKRKFYQLAQRFHPDRNMDHPEWTQRLSLLMDALTTAYRVLSDENARKRYDGRLAHTSGRDISERKRAAGECIERARECLAERNYVGSILWLRRAIDDDPDTSGHRAMLAQSLANIPEYRREAIEQFEKAIELDSGNITAHLQYGELLERLKLPGRARTHYVRILELDMEHRGARERLNRLNSGSPRLTSRTSLLSRLTGRR